MHHRIGSLKPGCHARLYKRAMRPLEGFLCWCFTRCLLLFCCYFALKEAVCEPCVEAMASFWEFTDLLLSKTVTFPLLLFVLYRTFVDDKVKGAGERGEEGRTGGGAAADEHDEEKIVIHALKDFDWTKEDPIKYRPFKKGEYKLTMGIHNIPPDEWFLVENTYKEYTDLKWSYATNPDLKDHGIFMADGCEEATIEFYQRSTQFMVDRYPDCFQVEGDKIINKIRGDWIPRDPYSVANKKDLHLYLSRFLEEDYIILYPEPERKTDEVIFKGGVFLFAAGFDPATIFNTPLTNIHGPVPEYKSKLRPQMNKFFDKLKPGVWVRRNNWSVQTHNRVFVMNDNKGKEDEEITDLDPDTLDFQREVFFRSERQILTRLPKTGAIIFSIRTYLTPMKQIRDEGNDIVLELIGGIEGMQGVIGQYKRRPAWGPAVIAYMKGESNGTDKPWIKGLQ